MIETTLKDQSKEPIICDIIGCNKEATHKDDRNVFCSKHAKQMLKRKDRHGEITPI